MENIQQSHKNQKEKNTSIIQRETIKPQKKKQKERNKEIQSQWEKLRFRIVMNTYLLMITLNVNELNAPSKRHRMAGWIKKKKSLHTRHPPQGKGHTQTESEEMEKGISGK